MARKQSSNSSLYVAVLTVSMCWLNAPAVDTRGGMEVAVAVDAVDAEVLQSARKRGKRSEKSEPQVGTLQNHRIWRKDIEIG